MIGCSDRLKTYTRSRESVATPATSPWLKPSGICSQFGTSSKVTARSLRAMCSGAPFRLCARYGRGRERGHYLIDELFKRVQRTIDRHVAEQRSQHDILEAGALDQVRNLVAHLVRGADVRLVVGDVLVQIGREALRRGWQV